MTPAQIHWTHRLAMHADLAAIVAIYNESIPSRMATADLDPVSVESRNDWFAQHRQDFRPLWVAEHSGRIAGWLSFSTFYGRPAYDKTAELSVYVDQAFHGRGLGPYLLAQAIGHAPSLGIDRLLGFVFAHNHPSVKLFERFGFEVWGKLPGVTLLDGIERDVIILGLSLTQFA